MIAMVGAGGELGHGRMEQKGERTHAHGQQSVSGCGEGSIRGLDSYGKSIIKIIYLKNE